MKSNENNIKKLLLMGLIGAIITFIGGELTIGWTVYPEASNYYSAMLAGCKNLTIFQLALGILFGGIGIPMQYYGFEAISKIIDKNKKSEKCAKLVHIGAVATAFFGSLVHILCIALMFIIKIEYQNGFLPDYTTMLGVLPQSALDFTMEKDDYKRLNEFRNKDFDNIEIDWYYKGGITIDQLANQFE